MKTKIVKNNSETLENFKKYRPLSFENFQKGISERLSNVFFQDSRLKLWEYMMTLRKNDVVEVDVTETINCKSYSDIEFYGPTKDVTVTCLMNIQDNFEEIYKNYYSA